MRRKAAPWWRRAGGHTVEHHSTRRLCGLECLRDYTQGNASHLSSFQVKSVVRAAWQTTQHSQSCANGIAVRTIASLQQDAGSG